MASFWDRVKGLAGFEAKSGQQITSSLELFKLVYGGRETRSGVAISAAAALEVTTVLACCRVLADGVAQIPFKIYQADSKGGRAPAEDHPTFDLVSARPNAWQTSFEFRETLMFHLALCFNAYVFVNRAGGEVRELIIIEPSRVKVEKANKSPVDQSVTYKVRGDNGEEKLFPSDTIWHLKGPSWNSWLGMDVVQLAREAIGLSRQLEIGQADFQNSGAKVSGVLAVEGSLSPEKYRFLADWLKQFSPGNERSGDVMVVDNGGKFQSMNMSAIDQQLIETRKHQIEEITRAFRIMPIMVGHADKTATYASAEQMFLAHVVHTLSPWYERIEQSANVNLLSDDERKAGLYYKFTPNGLMRGASMDRANFYKSALGAGGAKGWLTQNEVRALEELNRSDDPAADELPQAAAAPVAGIFGGEPAEEPDDDEPAGTADGEE